MTMQFAEKAKHSSVPAAAETANALAEPFLPPRFAELLACQRDLFEGTNLFRDTLRQRANNMLDHERSGLPPLLDFKYETLVDARQFERPANYALLRIMAVGDGR